MHVRVKILNNQKVVLHGNTLTLTDLEEEKNNNDEQKK